MVLGEQRGIQWLPTKYKRGGIWWLIYRILVCKIFYHNIHFILSLGRWYLKQPFLVWTLTKPSYVFLSRELGTTDYHSVHILVSDSFAYRSPLKNSLAQVKREKNLRENCVFYFDTEFGARKEIFVFLNPGLSSDWGINWMDLIIRWLIGITGWRLAFLSALSAWVVGRCSPGMRRSV